MGLAEKRAVQDFQKNEFPAWKSKLESAIGFPCELDVKWETLAEEGHDHLYKESFSKVYFQPLVEAMQAICQDDLGKEALKGVLKKIEIFNTNEFSSARGFTFVSGVLKYDHKPCTNIDDVKDRTESLVKMLEKSL